jgi:hypothetical protein
MSQIFCKTKNNLIYAKMVKVLWYVLEYVSQVHGGLLMEEKTWEQCNEEKKLYANR